MNVLISFFILLSSLLHPIKVSTCFVKHTKNKEKLEFVFRFYKDDFTAHLQELNKPLKVYEEGKGIDEKIVQDYIAKHFAMHIDNKKVAIHFQTIEEEELTYKVTYYSAPQKAEPKKTLIRVRNTMLHKAFEDQSNVVRVDLLGTKNYISFFLENHEPEREEPVF